MPKIEASALKKPENICSVNLCGRQSLLTEFELTSLECEMMSMPLTAIAVGGLQKLRFQHGNRSTKNDSTLEPKKVIVASKAHEEMFKLYEDILGCKAPERIELCPSLSKCGNRDQTGEAAKPPDKLVTTNSDIQRTEVNALNMEVETLRWQLAQTEANRQMHIALLKQIVTFLNRVKEHIECQKNDTKNDTVPIIALPKSFNLADLPRSKSVLHVNKNIEYSISGGKKIGTRKISKSISNVNGYKDCSGVWSQSKMSLVPENETGQKISEEMSRLITLANTVLSTKLPDLACAYAENIDITAIKLDGDLEKDSEVQNVITSNLNLIRENCSDQVYTNCNSRSYTDIISKIETEIDRNFDEFSQSLSSVTCNLDHNIKQFEKDHNEIRNIETPNVNVSQNTTEKRIDYNAVSNFIEDESGFSSMSSFQEIGIPIISIIPPSPCKEVGYLEGIPDIIEENEKWKTNSIELDKQSVKVFWV